MTTTATQTKGETMEAGIKTRDFEVQVSIYSSMIYTFRDLRPALEFAGRADGTVNNEFGTVLRRGTWDTGAGR